MKKTMSIALIIALLVTCFAGFGAPAALAAPQDVSITFDEMIEVFDRLQTGLAAMPAQDVDFMFEVVRAYVSTDAGMNTLISLVSDPNPAVPPTNSATLLRFFDLMGNTADERGKLTFVLSLWKCIPAAERSAAFDGMKARRPYSGTQNTIQQAATTALFDKYLGSAFENAANDSTHLVTRSVMLQFMTQFNKNTAFILTDDVVGGKNFARYWVSPSFSNAVMTNMADFRTINGKAWTTAAEFVDIIVDALNSSTLDEGDKANLKRFMTTKGIETYVAKETGGGSGGGGGGSKTSPIPSPTVSPAPSTAPPSPTPTACTLFIPTNVTPVSTPAISAGSSDTANHWSRDYISVLNEKGIIKGDDNGNMNPNLGITREDFAVMIVRMLGVDDKVSTTTLTFGDTNTISAYSKNAVALLVGCKVYEGYPDGSFRPKQVLTREEIATVWSRATAYNTPAMTLTYSDTSLIASWAVEHVKKELALGVMIGRGDNTFGPRDLVTRGEMAAMIYRMMYLCDILDKKI